MVATPRNDRFPPVQPNPTPAFNRLAGRVRGYLARHPEVSREEFLLDVVRKEIHAREQRETGDGGPARRELPGAGERYPALPPLSDEDVRIHVWLAERVAALHHERYGLWPRLRRFLVGNGLVRCLVQRGPEVTHQPRSA